MRDDQVIAIYLKHQRDDPEPEETPEEPAPAILEPEPYVPASNGSGPHANEDDFEIY